MAIQKLSSVLLVSLPVLLLFFLAALATMLVHLPEGFKTSTVHRGSSPPQQKSEEKSDEAQKEIKKFNILAHHGTDEKEQQAGANQQKECTYP
jgi:hypothetical protein